MTFRTLMRRPATTSDPLSGVERLFDDLRNRWPMALKDEFVGEFFPRLDVAEDDKGYEVTVELPGIEAKDVDVSVDQDLLTIRGKKEAERSEQKKNFYRTERSYGQFERQVTFPVEIEPDRVNAEFKNGVLKIHLGKAPEHQRSSRRVMIKAE